MAHDFWADHVEGLLARLREAEAAQQQNDTMRALLARIRALLEKIAEMGIEDAPDRPFYCCAFCGAHTQIPVEMVHSSDCLAEEASRLLAECF